MVSAMTICRLPSSMFLLAAVLTLILGACTEPPYLAYSPPDAPGSYLPGTATSSMTLSTGEDSTIQYWYPATDEVGGAYLYDGTYPSPSTKEQATPDCTQPRPVIMFSHGNGGIRFQSYFLTEFLATHGFVVVAPDHTGNTTFDLDDARRGEMAFRRPEDIQRGFDHAIADPFLEGCIDPERGYAMMGHSFGGYTSLAIAGATIDVADLADYCATMPSFVCDAVDAWYAEFPDTHVAQLGDPRAWASIPLTPAGYAAMQTGLAEIAIPMMVWGGSSDSMTTMADEVSPIYNALTATPRYLAELQNAGHYTFSDACEILPLPLFCGENLIPVEDAHPLINTSITTFLQYSLDVTDAPPLPLNDPAIVWESVVD